VKKQESGMTARSTFFSSHFRQWEQSIAPQPEPLQTMPPSGVTLNKPVACAATAFSNPVAHR
jgi:hypothetical protein